MAKRKAAKTAKAVKAPAKKASRKAPVRGRRTGLPMADGAAPVKAFIAELPPDHRAIVAKLDALIGKTVPGVVRAIKWSTPMYGLPGVGWFASVASFKNYVSMGFFSGASLDPQPPFGEGKTMRRVNIASMKEYDEKQFRAWIKQASTIKGWGKVG